MSLRTTPLFARPSLAAAAAVAVAAMALLPLRAARAADAAPFDLAGPTLEVGVTRGTVTRPIAQVPNLAAGDRLWIKADLPPTQSAHYVLVVAFLRGATNPPPADWFYRCDTWRPACAAKGLTVVVPPDAGQVLLFLAPATGGDFKTLVNAVRGRPGAFVRASQDLVQAALDRSRLEHYLAAVHALDEADQSRLKEAAPLLARSLAIKVEKNCLDRIPELQAPCLMQGSTSLILNDGHSTSIVEALTSGPAADLAMEAGNTPQLNYGYYSPYIGSLLDIARIMDSFHTAQYQYIPAIASAQGGRLLLSLNTPPSFHNPQSVLVAALPAVEPAQLPPLHAVDPKQIFCARRSALVLPVEGAPLVFSTAYAHDFRLTLRGDDGKSIELPATADAEQGGFVVDTGALASASFGDSVQGVLHGTWGFDPYQGPGFQLVNTRTQPWALAGDESAPVVGREDTVHLQAGDVSCIADVMLQSAAGKELKIDWKAVKSNQLEVKLPLQETAPGALTLLVSQYGATQPQAVALQAYSQPGHLDAFSIHAGDGRGVLKGTRLDQVSSLVVKDVEFRPGALSSAQGVDALEMNAPDAAAAAALKPRDALTARVSLKDGRTFKLDVQVDAPRPAAELIGRSVQPSRSGDESRIQLPEQDELPQDARLVFSLRAVSPALFAHDEKIEVATADESFSTLLSLANGKVTLENGRVAVASLDPASAFGTSAFGPLRYRVIVGGVEGDWQPLVTLVRLPQLRSLDCPPSPQLPCRLSGSNLFLIEAIAGDAQFAHPVEIPDGFPGESLPVPHPSEGRLYVKLRDDPQVIHAALPSPPPPAATVAPGATAAHE